MTIYNSLLYKNIQSVECVKTHSGYNRVNLLLRLLQNRL